MTKEQKAELRKLIAQLVSASEELGSITSSMHWNAVYFKQERAQKMVDSFIGCINEPG